jgi:hypothetical protein
MEPTPLNRALTQEQKMAAFASQFPALRGKPGVHPWDAKKLQRWASTVASSGERHCAVFCLNVWNPYHKWRAGRFNLVDACGVLDAGNREPILKWIANPWFP